MFFRLLLESFLRQRRRKALAGIAILLGTTAITAMLALATTIGDRIHQELAVYGANIVIYPKADQLDVKIGGIDIKPASGGAYLKESDLPKLKTIFWGNNITGVSPELRFTAYTPRHTDSGSLSKPDTAIPAIGLWFNHPFGANGGTTLTGARQLHPLWSIEGSWPTRPGEVVVGRKLATEIGNSLTIDPHSQNIFVLLNHRSDSPSPPTATGNFEHIYRVTGIVSTDSDLDNDLIFSLTDAQQLANLPDAVSRVEVSARTKPEDAFGRVDPASLPPKQREIWYCRPYANSIAYQIREVMPDAQAEQVRRVEQSEGTVLARISGLMWLISAAALLAAGFAVSAAMATAVLERRHEIGVMRSLGASKGAIALLFYAETALLAIFAGTLGYLFGSGLAAWLGARIFTGESVATGHILIPVLLPVVIATALIVAIAGSTPSIRAALRLDPSSVLRSDA